MTFHRVLLWVAVMAGTVAASQQPPSICYYPNTKYDGALLPSACTGATVDPVVASVDGEKVTANPTGFVITPSSAGATPVSILPGATPLIIGNEVVSLMSNGELVVDGSTVLPIHHEWTSSLSDHHSSTPGSKIPATPHATHASGGNTSTSGPSQPSSPTSSLTKPRSPSYSTKHRSSTPSNHSTSSNTPSIGHTPTTSNTPIIRKTRSSGSTTSSVSTPSNGNTPNGSNTPTTVNTPTSGNPSTSGNTPASGNTHTPSSGGSTPSNGGSTPAGSGTPHGSLTPGGVVIETTVIAGPTPITVKETFAVTTYPGYASLTTTLTTSTTLVINGHTTVVPIIIFPSGVGYKDPTSIPSVASLLPPPGNPTALAKQTSGGGGGTTVAPPLTTFTGYPPGFTSSVSTESDVTTDGSSRSHNGIVFPVFGGLHCFFCPPCLIGCGGGGGGHIGIVFPPLPPGVYPPTIIGPPGIDPITLPSITIGPSETPTYESENPTTEPTTKPTSGSSSSSSCTKSSTASSCGITISALTITKGSTISATTITTCSTYVGCSVTNTRDTTFTGTPTPTPTSHGAFRMKWPSNLTPADEDDQTEPGSGELDDVDPSGSEVGDSGPFYKRSNIAGRIDYDAASQLFSPTFPRALTQAQNWNGPDPANCLGIRARAPKYPGPDVLDTYQQATLWWTVKKVEGKDFAWTVTKTADLTGARNAEGVTYSTTGDARAPNLAVVNPDHVYEVKLLRQFFTYDYQQLGGTAICNTWKDFWLGENTANLAPYGDLKSPTDRSNWTRLKSIFNLLPGGSQPLWSDFAGVDTKVNIFKGQMLVEGLPDFTANLPTNTNPAETLYWLNGLATTIDFINQAEVMGKFSNVHTRLYKGFQQIDAITHCTKPRNNYAATYSAWISRYLNSQNAAVEAFVSNLRSNQLTDEKLAEDEGYKEAYDEITARHPIGGNSYSFNTLGYLQVNNLATNQVQIQKRAEEGSCPLGTSWLANPDATQTSGGGSGGGNPTGGSTNTPSGGITGSTTPIPTGRLTTSFGSTQSIKDPACSPFQDPDSGLSGYCQCTNGATTKFATGNNPCPYTQAPPSPTPTSAPITSIPPMTVTEPNGAVISCTSFNFMNNPAGSGTITECMAGSTVTTIPQATATCHVHIDQGDDYYDGPYWTAELWDANNNVVQNDRQPIYNDFTIGNDNLFGTITLPPTTYYGQDIEKSVPQFDFTSKSGDQTVDWQFTTDDTDNTKLPYCNVGGWSNGFLAESTDRDMDCYFTCFP